MGIFSRILGVDKAEPELLLAVDRAVSKVEPLLKQAGGYPENYFRAVEKALAYSRSLADSLPPPVSVDRNTFASDPLVHALFPSIESQMNMLSDSQSMRDYRRENPDARAVYAMMGMRRMEKTILGVELSGQMVQHDVPQNIIYFTHHTIENPAPSEAELRKQIAWHFFDKLVDHVVKRVDAFRQEKNVLLQKKDALVDKLHTSDEIERPVLEKDLSKTLELLQNAASPLSLDNYLKDFKAVLLNPRQYLQMNQTSLILDDMGIKRVDKNQGKSIVFNELIGFDRRNWTVALVYLDDIESFAENLEARYRRMVL